MCRSPNSSANLATADGTRSVPATFEGDAINRTPSENSTVKLFDRIVRQVKLNGNRRRTLTDLRIESITKSLTSVSATFAAAK